MKCVLGFLYFWADMSRGSFAEENAGRAALAVSCLFVWMKFWQTYFCSSVRACLGGSATQRMRFFKTARVVISQPAIQSTGLFLLPVGLITAAPFGWLYAFYQNVSYYGDGSIPEVRLIARKAWKEAGLHPSQNHVLIFLLSTFGIFVFLNLLSLGYLLPAMLKTFFGIETVFSMAGWHLLNTTFLAVICGLTYLIVDPLLSKPSRRKVNVRVDYVGFTIEDRFVVGYGLDYGELYRNLPYIGVLDSEP